MKVPGDPVKRLVEGWGEERGAGAPAAHPPPMAQLGRTVTFAV